MVPVYLDVFLHIETRRSKFMVVSTTNGTANLLLHAATSFSHADSAMIKLVTIQWKGKQHRR
jgi:hypothetical protein